jgi:hypothetical protein
MQPAQEAAMNTALRSDLRAAQRDALRFAGLVPTAPWHSRVALAAGRRRSRWALLVLSAAAVGVGLGWWHRQADAQAVVTAVAAPALEAAPQWSEPVASAAEPEPALGAVAPVAAAPTSAPSVRHEGGRWLIEAHRAPRAALASQLAAASSTALSAEALHWLAQAAPLTRRWQGASLQAAWQQVLDDDLQHALRCDARRCSVWIAGLAGPAAAHSAASTAPRTEPAAHPELSVVIATE